MQTNIIKWIVVGYIYDDAIKWVYGNWGSDLIMG